MVLPSANGIEGSLEVGRLVFIGGPPAVGKSTVLELLPERVGACACLDADDVRRIYPLDYRAPETKALAEHNVTAVLRGYLEAGAPVVFLAWVLANPVLIETLLAPLRGTYDSLTILYLVASPEALAARCAREPERGRVERYGLEKLREIESLPHPRIDTTNLDPAAVAQRIVDSLQEG